MSDAIYKMSREIVALVATVITINFILNDYIIRGISVFFVGGWYVLISYRYQKMYGIISPGYMYITLNMMIVYTFLASLITIEQINELNSSGLYGWWVNDYYWIYFWCIVSVFFVVTVYLCIIKEEGKYNNIIINDVCINDVLPGTLILLTTFIFTGKNADLIYPVVILSLVHCLLFRQYKYIVILTVVLLLDGGRLIVSRYYFIQVILPVIFIYIYKYNKIHIPFKKRIVYFTIFLFLAGLYGTVSEVVKLNMGWGGDYSLIYILSSSNDMLEFFERQFYRVFAIWIKLGGYIIYHVDNNGFFYGISFIKGMSSFFDVEYVSIPELGAFYDNAVYAQSGSLVEGYANFGIVGAVIYMTIIFGFMEKMHMNFIRKANIENLICLVVPFTKILIDGGSLYSAIFIWLCCKLLFIGRRVRYYILSRKDT